MLGKAGEIKTMIVNEKGSTKFDVTMNEALETIRDHDVIDVQFKSTADSDGVAWFNALIIYKESV